MATTPNVALVGKSRNHIQDLDDLLRCGICFDYFNIAMIIPQCSHNYCSLCIRKFLSYKTQCPTCCMTVVEPDLRNNRILDDVVKTFIAARQHLSQFIVDSPPVSPKNNNSTGKLAISDFLACGGKQVKQENKLMDTFLVKRNNQTSRRTLKVDKKKSADMNQESPSISTKAIKEEPGLNEDFMISDPSGFATPSTSALKVKVECPVCGVGIPEQYINKHLDSCLTRDEKKESLRSSRRKSMAKVVYNLLSERDLKKRLKEVGLSTHGSKQQMIRRHQEFVHMYNAQCDSLNPKSATEIVSEIENNEKVRAQLEAKQDESVLTFKKDQTEEEIDGIHQEYRNKHKSEFQQLISQVKNRKRKSGGRKIKEEPEDGPSRAEDTHVKEDEKLIKKTPAKEALTQGHIVEALVKMTPPKEALPQGQLVKALVKKTPTKEALPEGHLVGFHLEPTLQPVVRSSSPVFPLSPQSPVSRHSEPRARKRKISTVPRKVDEVTSRTKRQRK
ncbi:E3 ubiquitin-protein ligase RAD18 isoform 2-T2 [Discoglossus pictus]